MLCRSLHRPSWNLVSASWVSSRGRCSASSSLESPSPRDVFRTHESDPALHTVEHEAQFYSIPSDQVKSALPHGLPDRFQLQCKTFNETCLMVRQPALELIDYLRRTNFSQPALRYVLYGKHGTGKTLILNHILHYGHTQGWLIVHVPDAHLLVKNCKELMESTFNAQRSDQPIEASAWLKHFKAANVHFLSKIVTQQRYTWSKREFTEEGTPLIAVVDQGLTRVKTSSDVVGVVLKELKRQSGGDTFRILVSIDGANSLWGKTTLKKQNKKEVSPGELTLIHNFRKMVKNDWTGGAIVVSLSQTGALFKPKSLYLPQALLGKEGFDCLDPFIPIHVPKYSQKEFESCYQYYLERRWIQHEKARTDQGKAELMFLSNSNPRELEKICAFL